MMITKILNKLRAAISLLHMTLIGAYHFARLAFGRIQSKKMKEYSALVTVIGLFFLSGYILRLIDPTAGVFDAGVLQLINLTLVKYAVYLLVTWSSFLVIWPDLGHFMKYYFKENFKLLSPWQKILVSCFVYCFLMFMLVLLSALGL